MSNTAIKVENLSKIYRLGEIGTGTISRDMERWFKMKFLKQEDPFLKIGETNDRANKGASDIVYSLRDLNFEIEQGDAVGIIGRNGAGKSTLLKILSRVTTPTTGRINIKGRVASLLEVGTGFHPELTGRENIYLNGAILGMRKREIDRKLDEIIDFSGVERYIDTPVKRYSSGMYVRLAFAVAAHLESEILIVDEVLAVGDAEFQKKCIGKMEDVSKGEGRTVLFVSHNLASVKTLCRKGIVMDKGNNYSILNIDDALNLYLTKNTELKAHGFHFTRTNYSNGTVFIKEAFLCNEFGQKMGQFEMNEIVQIKLNIYCEKKVPGLYGYIAIASNSDTFIIECDSKEFGSNDLANMTQGENWYSLKIPAFALPHGKKRVFINLTSEFAVNFKVDALGYLLSFEVYDNITARSINRTAMTSHLLKWERA
jgi:lipopolysaccharide transport system ATP-binding protein